MDPDIEKVLARMTPPGREFVVIITRGTPESPEGEHYLDVFGPFPDWKTAADWNLLQGGVVHPLQHPD
jgi:hypothetical protein